MIYGLYRFSYGYRGIFVYVYIYMYIYIYIYFSNVIAIVATISELVLLLFLGINWGRIMCSTWRFRVVPVTEC